MVTSTTVILPKPRGRRWLRVLGLIVIFVAGMGTGASLTVVGVVKRIEYAIHHPDIVPPRLTKYLKLELKLNDSQSKQVLAIITQRQSGLENIRQQFRPQVQEQLVLLRRQIGDVLEGPQKEKWFELFDRAKDRWVPGTPVATTTQPSF